jgi:hypothetical protein
MSTKQARKIVVRVGRVHYTELLGVLRNLMWMYLCRGLLWTLGVPNPKEYGAMRGTEKILWSLMVDAEFKRLFSEQADKLDRDV